MSERSININYNNALKQAKKLESIASSINKLARTAETYNNDLQKNWTGDNARKYCAKVSDSKEQLKKKSKNLTNIANAIRQTAKAYKDAELQKLADESETE